MQKIVFHFFHLHAILHEAKARDEDRTFVQVYKQLTKTAF
ncbi:hypothetical protein NC99_01470 [Sunxiuqinia dokdonensis]|uniref:Uncharacterized protein n=1 Tax=Sunxiuqinia dokdonensis TaxID=1409788 RepID=A0A0L8VFQ7_9BACT|nr:hypothetical protein NC99_01470 [Sunxiuqinia dokdonensis]